MKYLRATMMESQRFHMLDRYIIRTLTKDTIVGGYNVPAGTEIFLHSNVVANDRRFFRSPGSFKPERWFDIKRQVAAFQKNSDDDDTNFQWHPYAFLPYGGGSRECPGMDMSEFITMGILATMLRRYELVWPYEMLPNESYHYDISNLRVPDQSTIDDARFGVLRLVFRPRALLEAERRLERLNSSCDTKQNNKIEL
jgi:cytochrome P450